MRVEDVGKWGRGIRGRYVRGSVDEIGNSQLRDWTYLFLESAPQRHRRGDLHRFDFEYGFYECL